MSLPGLNYVVLDANQTRARATIEALIAEYDRSGQKIVLPWVHAFEHSKGSDDGFHRAHECLRDRPDAVVFARSTSILHSNELWTRRPARVIEDRANTIALRRYLSHPAPAAAFDVAPLRHGARRLFRRTHPERWMTSLIDCVQVEASTMKVIRRELQQGGRTTLRDVTIELFSKKMLPGHLRALKIAHQSASLLARFPSFCALTLVANFLAATRWQAMRPSGGGWEDNEGADIEAVLIASHGRGLVSDDRRAKELDEDIRIVAREIWG